MGKAARAKVEALVPKNPIELFCEQLKDCAQVNSAIDSVGESGIGYGFEDPCE
jgi:hypothetical protein